jgi:hypothetical protein
MANTMFGQEKYYELVSQGDQSKYEAQRVMVIDSDEELERMQELLEENGVDMKRIKVKWRKESVIMAFGGQYRTGGYSIDVSEVNVMDDDQIKYTFKVKTPARDSMVTEALTTPYMIIKVPYEASEVEVAFK